MKIMTKDRFFEKDINCAAVIHINGKKATLQETMFENKSGFCYGKSLGKNANIIDIIKDCSINEEKEGLWKAPKLEITTEPLDPPVDMFRHYTAALEMTPQEFGVFRQIAKDGQYLIAFAE